jgi:hypothetical protein
MSNFEQKILKKVENLEKILEILVFSSKNFAFFTKILAKMALQIFAGAGKIFRGGPLFQIFKGGVAFVNNKLDILVALNLG